MKNLKLGLVALTVAGALSIACASPGIGPKGGIFEANTIGLSGNGDGRGSKTGEACAHSILGIIGVGGSSVGDIATEAGITEIKSVTVQTLGVLVLYANACTVVTGD